MFLIPENFAVVAGSHTLSKGVKHVEVISPKGNVREDIEWDYFALSCCMTACMQEEFPNEEYQDGKTYGDLEKFRWVDFSWFPISDAQLYGKGNSETQ